MPLVLASHCRLEERLAAGELLQRFRHVRHIRQLADPLGLLDSCNALRRQGCFAADLADSVSFVFSANGRVNGEFC